MRTNFKSLLRQIGIFAISTVLAFVILLKFGVISKLSYHVEKGRLQALRESMPASGDLDPWNDRTRRIAKMVAPAVVQIVTERKFTHIDVTHLESLLGQDDETNSTNGLEDANASTGDEDSDDDLFVQDGYGSGFVVDAELGLVVTNNHVIDGAETIHVYLPDGRRVDAIVRGADRKSDIAVLQISADQLHALPIATSDSVEVGDDVLAVGNPFGLEGSFSRGIISAKSRSRIPIEGVEYRGFLQTDAVINPGNSGGPLINMQGEVIGINTAIATESGHYGGVGFAIPSSRVARLLPVLQRGAEVVRGYLGVSIVSVEQETELAKRLEWDRYWGVIVRRIQPDSPAARHDIREGDIITRIDGIELRDTDALINTVAEISPDTSTPFAIWRDGKELSLDVTIGHQPAGFTPRPGRRP
ncbi:MAG: hypothetical protein DHS20C16_21350 [Phycisphaerae bacterium]|nr:MAG: hypothetical protein DHS20C16_21350 [Phycisphaerae bacterium]